MMWNELKKKTALTIAAALCVLSVTACTSIPGEQSDADPWEPFNRGMYRVNYVFDGVVLKPVTQIYRGVIPQKGQTMVHNFVENLESPITLGNSLLQGDPENSFATLWRFLINSTFGVAGLFDAASEVGLKNRKADFGQTLALYGVESGPYLFLPVFGPSGARDGVGLAFDAFMHPAMYVNSTGASVALWTTSAADKRSQNFDLIEDINRSSLDPYVTFRSSYKQYRKNNIKKARAERDKAWKKAGFIQSAGTI